ncbi:phosphatidylinositol 4-kinase gamma 1 [Zea mays]|nr:phosphatidylinositol 4-kinase gamma 1 [Zea mays]XP_008673906.1 phosphatidylinositol 4-kinase gamma 1 [Zea mays]|eukprot:XP_008673905.1 phosphatidylinositol 4-kinase gamma 1 [Zea mays]
MAIAVGHFHDLKPPAVRDRHYSLHSVALLDSLLLDRDHREHGDAAAAAGGGHTGLSPRRRSQSSPCFTTVAPAGSEHADQSENKMPRVEIVVGRHARGVRELIAEAAVAIASGTRLVPAQSGLGGALLLNGSRAGEHVAVIKPLDDTAAAGSSPANGGGYASKTVLREVAAFLLDHDGFASVEPTALIKISSPAMATTVASIQRFVAHEYDAGELGPSRFSVASVHRVGIIDVRLLNIDRHAGNILVKNPPSSQRADSSPSAPPRLDLVPIDHGLCLPEQLEDPYFEWLHWPQSSLPFSDDELAYVASLDPFKDAETLRAELPSLKEPAIRILTVCTIFLKRAAAAGLCLADIGDMMTREFTAQQDVLSTLEALCKQARDSILLLPRLPSFRHPSTDGDGVDEGTAVSGGRKHVSFGDLSFAEWVSFLERFEQLLPAALEAKKRAGLRTSSSF